MSRKVKFVEPEYELVERFIVTWKYSRLSMKDVLSKREFKMDYGAVKRFLAKNPDLDEKFRAAKEEREESIRDENGALALRGIRLLLEGGTTVESDTIYEPVTDDDGQYVYIYQRDRDGKVKRDDKGEPIPRLTKDGNGQNIPLQKMRVKAQRVKLKEHRPDPAMVKMQLEKSFPQLYEPNTEAEAHKTEVYFTMNEGSGGDAYLLQSEN